MIFGLKENYSIDTDETIECNYESFIEGAGSIIAESELNYSNIMKAVGLNELASFQATGGDDVLYESMDGVKDFFKKVKEFFLKMLAKLRGLFNKFIALFNSYTKNDKDFVSKYRKTLTGITSFKGFSYKGFKYTIDTNMTKSASSSIYTYINNIIPVLTDSNVGSDHEAGLKKLEDFNDVEDAIRGEALGKSGGFTAAEYRKELFEMLRNGESSKETIEDITSSDVREFLNTISDTSKDKKAAKDTLKPIEDKIKASIKELEKMEKAILNNKDDEKASDKMRAVKGRIDLLKAEQTALQEMNGQIFQAIKQRNRQAKAVCVSLINFTPKKESYEFGENEYEAYGENFLNGVTLV